MLDEPENKTAKPNATDRLDAITAAAYEIIDRENAAREAKTARLRAARLAQEAAAEHDPCVPETQDELQKVGS